MCDNADGQAKVCVILAQSGAVLLSPLSAARRGTFFAPARQAALLLFKKPNFMSIFKHGARPQAVDSSTRFRLWAPQAETAHVVLASNPEHPVAMRRAELGYYEAEIGDCPTGSRYQFQVDGGEPRPDPASLSQPEGVHKASEVLDPTYSWSDTIWTGIPLEEYIIYELHVGTFTEPGTFDAAIREIPRLKQLGITAIELMPLAQFPGARNWGYDGVYPYAVQESYGGLKGLQRFVDAAHGHGLAVVLDVVYNHLGPEGNYISAYGPYFTDDYRTPWGQSLNFDGPHNYGVRDFFIGNALFWVQECHIDALRLDAVHAIIDQSALSFLKQLTREVHDAARHLHRRVHVILENDRNDPAGATSAELGGIGADSQWSDDFHHAIHALITGEAHGYYKDFGRTSQLAKAITDGYIYDGTFSENRQSWHGDDSRHLEGHRFVVCSQNHDQIGNRPLGDRLAALVPFPAAKLAAMVTLLAPNIPLLFMGEEWGLKTPFLYFVSHSDPDLVAGVRAGRAEEFSEFFAEGEAPDPQSEETYNRSRVYADDSAEALAMYRFYQDVIALRKTHEALQVHNKRRTEARASDQRKTLVVHRPGPGRSAILVYNFADHEQAVDVPFRFERGRVLVHTEDSQYGGASNNSGREYVSNGELSIVMPAQSGVVIETVEDRVTQQW